MSFRTAEGPGDIFQETIWSQNILRDVVQGNEKVLPEVVGVYISAGRTSVQWQLEVHITWTRASCKQSPEAGTFDLLFVRAPHVHGAETCSITFAIWLDFSHESHTIQSVDGIN